ncbi:MAG: TolC family protein, partial [Gemmatimonadaceae bacterium]
MRRTNTRAVVHGAFIIPLLLAASRSIAQEHVSVVDSLVMRALTDNPRLAAAREHVAAARSRVAPAGAWADPMLMAGIQNLPVSRGTARGHGASTGPEPMTMKMLGIGQTVPFPGKTSLRSSAARAEVEAAEARLATVRLTIRREVLDAYHDLAAARSVLTLVDRRQQVAASVLPAAEARYVAGTAAQSDVLKARTEAAFLVEERNVARQQERVALARLNAALDRSSATAVRTEDVSPGVAASALPPLDSLIAIGLQANPRLRERRAIIAAQTAQAALARREHLPDFHVAVQY